MNYQKHTYAETTTVGRDGASHSVSSTSESAVIYDESGRGTPQERLMLHDPEEDDGDGNEIDDDERWVGRGNIGGDGSNYDDHSRRNDDKYEESTASPDDDFEDNDVKWVGSGSIQVGSGGENYEEQEYEDDGYVEPEDDDFDDDAGAYDDDDY